MRNWTIFVLWVFGGCGANAQSYARAAATAHLAAQDIECAWEIFQVTPA
ncbi:MAG: hypothetical protein AB8H86_18565 [Polyangiales bacterium]